LNLPATWLRYSVIGVIGWPESDAVRGEARELAHRRPRYEGKGRRSRRYLNNEWGLDLPLIRLLSRRGTSGFRLKCCSGAATGCLALPCVMYGVFTHLQPFFYLHLPRLSPSAP